jgi:endonuclease G
MKMPAMRYLLPVALLALPASAVADDNASRPDPQVTTETDKAIIGGTAAPAGKWPDTVLLMWSGYGGCTGTLIAPTVVLTAGHCVIGFDGPPNYVLINSITTSPSGGELIHVKSSHEYPNSQGSIDAAILVLDNPSTTAPRAIATGWAKYDIQNGASVAIVGFGTTDRDGMVESNVLREATTTITDFNCTKSSGCTSYGRPDGELGAGGMGIDTCPGDSGGPLYLLTDYGNFVAGITSRAYSNNRYYCSEGGIYGRPDKIVDWIEETAGVKVSRGPAPTAEPFNGLGDIVRGNPGETKLEVNDPKSSSHQFEVVKQPGYAKAAVSGDGTVRVCPNKDIVGGDTVTVKVTDSADANRTQEVTLAFQIVDGDPADSCDPAAFGDMSGGGCCDTRRDARGSIPLLLFVAAMLLRRRRAR